MMIPFEREFRKRYYDLLDQVFDSSFWSEGEMIRTFEEKFAEYVGLASRTVTNGGTGLLAILDRIDVNGKDVVVPTNTFWATAMAVKKANGRVIYADCNRNDLCLSYDDMVRKVTDNTKAIIVTHIGGHIAFEIEKIAEYCARRNIYLIEDCAHAHGATYKGKAAGSWGFAGSYSFYATKTMPTGEGGMVVSRDNDLLKWVEKYRNYGKQVIDGKVNYPVKNGFNYRMNEFTAALGIVQLEQLPLILEWKNELAFKYDQIFQNRVIFPKTMVSGYYKYIVFDHDLKEETGRVFARTDFGHVIDGHDIHLPNAEWIADHHRCAPIYYGWDKQNFETDELRDVLLKDVVS